MRFSNRIPRLGKSLNPESLIGNQERVGLILLVPHIPPWARTPRVEHSSTGVFLLQARLLGAARRYAVPEPGGYIALNLRELGILLGGAAEANTLVRCCWRLTGLVMRETFTERRQRLVEPVAVAAVRVERWARRGFVHGCLLLGRCCLRLLDVLRGCFTGRFHRAGDHAKATRRYRR